MQKLSVSMWSVLRFMAEKKKGVWYPGSTSNRDAYYSDGDWADGRSPNALHALVRRGLVLDGNKSNPRQYGCFELTQSGWDLIKQNPKL